MSAGEQGLGGEAGVGPTNQLEQWAQVHRAQDSTQEEGFDMVIDAGSDRHSGDRNQALSMRGGGGISSTPSVSVEGKLLDIAQRCSGYSGRSLRKLPLKAHAMYLQRKKVSLEQYLNAIATTIDKQK